MKIDKNVWTMRYKFFAEILRVENLWDTAFDELNVVSINWRYLQVSFAIKVGRLLESL